MNRADIKRLLQEMDEYEFEHLVADLWGLDGWNTIVSQASNDKGIDVTATKDVPFSRKELIQAKRYADGNYVGGPEIQQYSSLQIQEPDVDSVVVVTTSRFSKPAEDMASRLNVKLIDGDLLVDMVKEKDEDLVTEYLDSEDSITSETNSLISISSPHTPLNKAIKQYPERVSTKSLRNMEQLRQLFDFLLSYFKKSARLDMYFTFDRTGLASNEFTITRGEEIGIYYQFTDGNHTLKNLSDDMVDNLESLAAENGLTIKNEGDTPSDERVVTVDKHVKQPYNGVHEIQVVDLLFSEVYAASFSDIDQAVIRHAEDIEGSPTISDLDEDQIIWPDEDPSKLSQRLSLSAEDLRNLGSVSSIVGSISEEQVEMANNDIAWSAHKIVNHEHAPNINEYLTARRKFLELDNEMADLIHLQRLVLPNQHKFSANFSEAYRELLTTLESLREKNKRLIELLDEIINTQITGSSELKPGVITSINSNQIKLAPSASAESWEEMKTLIEREGNTSVDDIEEKIKQIPDRVEDINEIQGEAEIAANEVINESNNLLPEEEKIENSRTDSPVRNLISRAGKIIAEFTFENSSVSSKSQEVKKTAISSVDRDTDASLGNSQSQTEDVSVSLQPKELAENALGDSITTDKLTHVGSGNITANYVHDKPIIEYLDNEEQPHYFLYNEMSGVKIGSKQIKSGWLDEYRNSMLVTDRGVHYFVGREKGDFHEFLPYESIDSVEAHTNWRRCYISLKSNSQEYYFRADQGGKYIKNPGEYIKKRI